MKIKIFYISQLLVLQRYIVEMNLFSLCIERNNEYNYDGNSINMVMSCFFLILPFYKKKSYFSVKVYSICYSQYIFYYMNQLHFISRHISLS